MKWILSQRALLILSIAYGVTVALVGALSGPVGPVALLGALVVGGLWAVRGVIVSRSR
jgi:hypothetical protein